MKRTGPKNTVAATTSVDALVRARHEALTAHVAGPHRMEMVANVNDVVYINDSKATFIDAALDSLVSLEARVIWIAGTWSDDMSEGQVAELLRERVSALVLFGVAAEELPADTGCEVYLADNLPMAVFLARELARPNEVVLFSPACPSGSGHANYEERGADFKRTVRELE
jgi:UDP-N-acetylmuramoylalanine--D-glutamate ligase